MALTSSLFRLTDQPFPFYTIFPSFISPLTHRDGSDGEGDHVGGRGDGDGDAGVLHRLADPLGERDLLGGLVAAREEVVPALHYDEHVVDADA